MTINLSSLTVTFNSTNVVTCSDQKHLGVVLDQQLNFNNHIQMTKCYRMITVVLLKYQTAQVYV